ncbi:MAG: glucodextranase DOMON-like domain-containing protein [Infirmifilum sp.]
MVKKDFKLLVSFLLALTLTLTFLPIVKAENPTISVQDPTGDDKGPGFYGYPTNDVFKPGVFDITGFSVTVTNTSLTFKVDLKDLGGNPWGGKNGFCLQQVHIYLHTDAPANVPARASAIGLNLNFDPSWAWHYAILAGPCWETPPQPLPTGQCAVLYRPFDEVVQDDQLKVSVQGNSIIITVDRKLFEYGDPANIKNWRILVAVTSHDGFGPMKIRGVGLSKGEWNIWGTATANDTQKVLIAKAIQFGIEPRVLDIAVYSPEYPNGITADQQYAWLSSIDVNAKQPATIPPLATAQLKALVQERDSLKSQVSNLQSQIQSLQGQIQSLQSQIQNLQSQNSGLQSQVKSLQDQNSKLSSELEALRASTMDTTTAIVLALVLLIVGAVVGYFLGSKKKPKTSS